MSTACEQRGITDAGTAASGSEGLGCRRGTTYHGDARGIFVFFRDDAYQSGSQQQENEGIFKLKKNPTNCNVKLNTELLTLSWPQTSPERIRQAVWLQGPSLLVRAASLWPDRAGAAPVVRLTWDPAPGTGDGHGQGPAGQGSHQKTRVPSLFPCVHREGSPLQSHSAGLTPKPSWRHDRYKQKLYCLFRI